MFKWSILLGLIILVAAWLDTSNTNDSKIYIKTYSTSSVDYLDKLKVFSKKTQIDLPVGKWVYKEKVKSRSGSFLFVEYILTIKETGAFDIKHIFDRKRNEEAKRKKWLDYLVSGYLDVKGKVLFAKQLSHPSIFFSEQKSIIVDAVEKDKLSIVGTNGKDILTFKKV